MKEQKVDLSHCELPNIYISLGIQYSKEERWVRRVLFANSIL